MAVSEDLRIRLARKVASGMSRRQAAALFEVSASSAVRYVGRYEDEGTVAVTLEPIRELLLQGFMGEKFGRDSIWESHLSEEMWVTHVDLEAVLETQSLPLSWVINLEVGSQLTLQAKPDSQITLRCGDQDMFTGRMGRKGQNLAIRLDRKEKRAEVEL